MVLRRVWDERADDDLSTRASAIAYSAMFAIPGLLIAVVSIYGLVANPSQVTSLLDWLESRLPGAAGDVIGGQLESIVAQNSGALSFGALLGLASAIWSVSGGVNRLRNSINEVYDEDDSRPWYAKRAWSIVASIAVIAVIAAAVGLIAVVPPLVEWADAGSVLGTLLLVVRWVVLGLLMVGAIGALYRMGPRREPPRWWWISVGTVLATVAWIVMSIGFGLYVQNFGSYNETYGSLGSVIVFMTWLYLSAYIVLIAGELNAELEDRPGAPAGTERETSGRRHGTTA